MKPSSIAPDNCHTERDSRFGGGFGARAPHLAPNGLLPDRPEFISGSCQIRGSKIVRVQLDRPVEGVSRAGHYVGIAFGSPAVPFAYQFGVRTRFVLYLLSRDVNPNRCVKRSAVSGVLVVTQTSPSRVRSGPLAKTFREGRRRFPSQRVKRFISIGWFGGIDGFFGIRRIIVRRGCGFRWRCGGARLYNAGGLVH